MKLKYILVVIALQYVLLLFIGSVYEKARLDEVSAEIENMVSLAAEQALDQVQATDDFFLPGEGYQLKGGKQVQVRVEGGERYKKVSMLDIYTGRTDKEGMYQSLYTKGQIPAYINKVEGNVRDITDTLSYWAKDGQQGIQIYNVPKLAMLGTDVVGGADCAYATDSRGKRVSDTVYGQMNKDYKLGETKKRIRKEGQKGGEDYYLTPLSLGITYLDAELLQYYYMSNLDVLMRSKYVANGKKLTEKEGGFGLLKGEMYAEAIKDDLSRYNPINNGNFTLLRKDKQSRKGVSVYKGVLPKIEYKVVDIYAEKNDRLLKHIYGVTPNLAGSKAKYFREKDKDKRDLQTGRVYKSKPVVVAKVTFYADIVVPYVTPGLREMRAREQGGLKQLRLGANKLEAHQGNWLDVERKGKGRKGVLGNTLYEYTTFFVVTP